MSDYDPFAEIYDEWAQAMTEDVPFYVELAREADGPIVELAVGNGRVAIPVARETGRKVIGIDTSPAMLAQARERGQPRQASTSSSGNRTCATSSWRSRLGSSIRPFRALLHLPTWQDRRRVFERVAAALRPGGRFAWNVFVFDPMIAAGYAGPAAPAAGRQHLGVDRVRPDGQPHRHHRLSRAARQGRAPDSRCGGSTAPSGRA